MAPPDDDAPLFTTRESCASSVMVNLPREGLAGLESTKVGDRGENPLSPTCTHNEVAECVARESSPLPFGTGSWRAGRSRTVLFDDGDGRSCRGEECPHSLLSHIHAGHGVRWRTGLQFGVSFAMPKIGYRCRRTGCSGAVQSHDSRDAPKVPELPLIFRHGFIVETSAGVVVHQCQIAGFVKIVFLTSLRRMVAWPFPEPDRLLGTEEP